MILKLVFFVFSYNTGPQMYNMNAFYAAQCYNQVTFKKI